MKLTTRKVVITVLVLLLTVLIIRVVTYYTNEKKILARCTYNEDWAPGVANFVVSCHGVLSVQVSDSPTADKYIVYDQKNEYIVAGLQSKDAVIEKNGFLYLIDQRLKYDIGKDEKPRMILQVDEGPQFGSISGDRTEDLPHYLKISTTTGIVTPYKILNQIPEADRAIFQQLAGGQ